MCDSKRSTSDTAESTLTDSSGTSPDSARKGVGTGVLREATGSTQKVSRENSRQLKFSSRLPSSM
jgi:hypothetical protein